MPASKFPWLYRDLDAYDRAHFDWYNVAIVPVGPRGGKKKPLFSRRIQAADYNEAVEFAKAQVFLTTDIEVTW